LALEIVLPISLMGRPFLLTASPHHRSFRPGYLSPLPGVLVRRSPRAQESRQTPSAGGRPFFL